MLFDGWSKRTVLRTLWVAFLCVLAYRMTGFPVFFLFPLQLIFEKEGSQKYLQTIAVYMIVLGMSFIWSLVLKGESILPAELMIIGMALLMTFFQGAVNVYKKPFRRRLDNLVLYQLVLTVVLLPYVLFQKQNGFFRQLLTSTFETVKVSMLGPDGQASTFELALFVRQFNAELMAQQIEEYIYLSYSFFMFFSIGLAFWLTKVFLTRVNKLSSFLQTYRIQKQYVWLAIATLTALLMGFYLDIPLLKYPAGNLFFTLLILYGFQGAAISNAILKRKGWTDRRVAILNWFFLMLLLWPRVNMIVVFGFPLLGISETWIQYRHYEKGARE